MSFFDQLCPAMTNGTNGKERKKRFGGETPTDARFFCRAGGHGRCPHPNPPPLAGGGNGRGQHIYRRSTAVLVPRSLSSQGTQHQAFASWDVAARVGLSVERALPAPTCPSPARSSRPGRSAEGLMPNAARGADREPRRMNGPPKWPAYWLRPGSLPLTP